MKRITFQMIRDWVFTQPDDKSVVWLENRSGDQCGCLMVQYGRDQGFGFDRCGVSSWRNQRDETVAVLTDCPFTIFRPNSLGVHCFKEIKTLLEENSYEALKRNI